MNSPTEYQFIDSPQALSDYCQQLSGCEWLALDTEFLRERTYYPKLCLLQIASSEGIACIDPLALDDLSELMKVIYNTSILKIFHAGRQDLEIFLHLEGQLPSPLYDTQLAAALLCDSEQIGYANLVQQQMGVELKKNHTRTDWSRRPLNTGQLEYAADDVRYLYPIYEAQRATLLEQNKLDWLADDFAALADKATYQMDPRKLWTKVKQHRKLKGRQLAVLRELAAWREQHAEQVNKPKRWILKDEALLEIARFMPESLDELEKIRDIEAGHIRNIGEQLLHCVNQGKAADKADWPNLNKVIRLTPEQDAQLDYLMSLVRLRALERGLSPSTLASRKMLEAFLQDPEDNSLCRGWRKSVIGNSLRQALRGEIRLQLEDGRLNIVST